MTPHRTYLLARFTFSLRRSVYAGQAVINMNRKRILTGDRPTNDSFHLGNYVGSLKNRVKLQDEYEMFIPIVDLHALTTYSEKTDQIEKNIRGLLLGYLSVGLDPKKVTFFVQSKVPEVLELAYYLGVLTPRSIIAKQPALKEKLDQGNDDTVGLFYYPVLMAADILLPRANLVPVGKDQKAHVEYARDVAIKFNKTFEEVFPIPEPLVADGGTLPGTDGQAKMGKSTGNAIFLTDSTGEVRKKVMGMYTDPNRIHGDEPGKVEGNPVFVYLDAFSEHGDLNKIRDLKERYKKGNVRDVEVKEYLIEVLERFLEPVRELRTEYEKDEGLVEKVLREGTEKATVEARKTLNSVRRAMKIDYFE